MNPLVAVFNTILYQPLFNVLVLLYQYLPGQDFGVAVIALTLLLRILMHPLGIQAIKSQKAMSEIQPKLEEIKEKYKNDKAALAKASMELYKEANVNPFSGCLPLLIQLPILLALYRVFWRGLSPEAMAYLYSFVPNPGLIDTNFLGLLNLGESSAVLAVAAGVAQFFQAKTGMSRNQPQPKKTGFDFSQMLQKQMLYFFPAITVLIVWRLPSAIALYWLVSSLFAIGEQYLVLKPKKQNAVLKKQEES